ncbi:unnamed protein product [Rhodiola kirilowii]
MQALTRRSRFIISNSISRVAHFSSHQFSASRRYDDDARNVRVSVWWDFENIHLLTTVSPYQVSQRITAALRANGIKGPVQISAYGNIYQLTRSIQEAFSSTGISLIHVPAGGKNGADRLLIIDMMYWVSQHPPPAHLFLISGDSDFAAILHRLRMSNYNILLANGARVSTALCSAASVVWKWNTLLEGDNLAGKRFTQPPDGLSGSWYGNTRLPLETLFPSVDHQPAGEVSSESETKDVLRPIPSVVVNKICQILSSHPKGVSITILRQELTNEMILDDDLYGYKKFSLFLSAMPDILSMHPLGAGQYSVCGVNSKAPRSPSTDSSMNSSESSTANDSDHSTPLTKVEVHDVSSSTKPEDKEPAHSSPVLSSHKKPQSSQLLGLGSFTKQKMQHPSPAIHVEEPSPVTHSLGPPNNDKDTVGSCDDHLAVIKKQYDSKGDSYFQRFWKRFFGGNDDLAMSIQENNTVIQIPTSPSSPSFDSPPVGKPVKPEPYDGEGHEKSEAYDEGHERRGFFNRIINLFKLDGYEIGTVSEASSSEYKENDIFLKDGFWAEIKSFLGTPHGADIVSKSKSRVHIAQSMKNAGPAILHTFEESDILHLVDLLIDDKRWVGECPSHSSPFKVISVSGESLSENPNKSNALSSRFILKQQQQDLQKLPKHDGEIKNQKPPGDNKRSSEKTRTRMLGDCRRLLNEVVKEHPQGFPLRGFRKLFAERYCYNLNLEALGFETLASLVKKIPGLTVEGAFVYPSRKPLDATWRSSISDISSDSTRKSAHSGSDREQTGTSRNYKQPLESHYDELGPVMDLTQTRSKLKR